MVSLRQFCDYLDVDWSGQRQRVLRDDVLCVDFGLGVQRVLCGCSTHTAYGKVVMVMVDNMENAGDGLEGVQEQEKALIPIQEGRTDFHGDELQVLLVEVEGERRVYVPIRQFCDYLKLDWSGQRQRMVRDETLAEEMTSVVITPTMVPGQGYKQRYTVICLPLEMLPGWLFGVTPSRVKQEFREKVRLYRKKCYRALWDSFLRGELFPEETAVVISSTMGATTIVPSGDPRIDALTEQIDFLTSIKAFLEEHRAALLQEIGVVLEAGQQQLLRQGNELSAQLTYITSLLEGLVGRQAATEAQLTRVDERTKRLTPAHARAVQGMVERIVEAHRRRHPRGPEVTHMHVYSRLKTRFRAGKFDEIDDARYGEVETFLHEMLQQVMSGEEPTQGSLF